MPTLDDIRAQLRARGPVWQHALAVVDTIEAEAKKDWRYSLHVKLWLVDANHSTVWLRDVLMEPLRQLPHIVEIGKQFNPTTEWHNTWMPLDAAMHRARNGIAPEDF